MDHMLFGKKTRKMGSRVHEQIMETIAFWRYEFAKICSGKETRTGHCGWKWIRNLLPGSKWKSLNSFRGFKVMILCVMQNITLSPWKITLGTVDDAETYENKDYYECCCEFWNHQFARIWRNFLKRILIPQRAGISYFNSVTAITSTDRLSIRFMLLSNGLLMIFIHW